MTQGAQDRADEGLEGRKGGRGDGGAEDKLEKKKKRSPAEPWTDSGGVETTEEGDQRINEEEMTRKF